MKIPETLKVGGMTYIVNITDNVSYGSANVAGEIDYRQGRIMICPLSRERMERTFFHEMLHAILDHLGYAEHDEQQLDALANALHMVFTDNPQIFEN